MLNRSLKELIVAEGIMENIKHPYYDLTLEDSLKMAKSLIYGPFMKVSDPTPSIPDALSAIRKSRQTCGFNWITGFVAEQILRVANGEKIKFTIC
jgi:hypothetical protein